jgi:hypothetical protein
MSSTLKILGGLALAGALSSSAQAQGLVTERNIPGNGAGDRQCRDGEVQRQT